DELIDENPVARVRTPKMHEVRRERMILTDDEYLQYFACAEADLEIRMMVMISRCAGGARTGDLNRLDWSQIDTFAFEKLVLPRPKTLTPQELEIPAPMRPHLRAWWEQHGSPRSGPCFPCRRGPRKGGFKKPQGNTYSGRFRRDLLRAGINRPELHNDTSVSL